MVFIEFSPLYSEYRDLLFLDDARKIVSTHNECLAEKSQKRDKNIKLLEAFNINADRLRDAEYYNDVLTAIDDLKSRWFHHHPGLHEFFVWDQAKGLGKMLKGGTLSLLMTLILNDSPRTVLFLQYSYYRYHAILDGKVGTLISQHRDERHHRWYRRKNSFPILPNVNAILKRDFPAIRRITLPTNPSYKISLLTYLTVMRDPTVFDFILDTIKDDFTYLNIEHHDERISEPEDRFVCGFCKERRLRCIRRMLETLASRDNQEETFYLLGDFVVETIKIKDDDFLVELLTLGKTVGVDLDITIYSNIIHGDFPRSLSFFLDQTSEEIS